MVVCICAVPDLGMGAASLAKNGGGLCLKRLSSYIIIELTNSAKVAMCQLTSHQNGAATFRRPYPLARTLLPLFC